MREARFIREMDAVVENHLMSHSLDLVVGIPSYNEADNIDFVVRQVAQGLSRYFPHLDTAIVNTDNCFQDGTREVFLKSDSGSIPKVYPSLSPRMMLIVKLSDSRSAHMQINRNRRDIGMP